MAYHWLRSPKVIMLTPVVLLLLFALACGGTAAEPVIVEKEVIKEVVKEVIVEKEVIKEVPVEVVVEKEVIKQVVKEITVIATAVPVLSVAADRPAWVDTGAANHYRGDFPLLASRNPGFWDSHYGGSLNSTLVPGGPRFNQLIEYNPTNPTEVIGDLAKTWDVNKAGDEYIFHLNDAKWSDGTPVTADDIVFSLDRITDPDALRARTGFLKNWYERGQASAIDAKTVKVPLKYAAALFIPNLAGDYMKMYPRHVVENLPQEDMNCCPEKYIGSGPWTFRSWKKDSEYIFDRNPNYFKGPRPFFDGLHIFIVRQVSRQQAALVAGQAFGHFNLPTELPADWAPIEKDTKGRMRALVVPEGSLMQMWVNPTAAPFDDPKVRRALFLAVDRNAAYKTVYGEDSGSPGTFFGPGYVEHLDQLADVPGYRANKQEDFAEAKKLLAEAGYADGLKVDLNATNRGSTLRLTEAVTAQLRKDVGIDFTLVSTDLPSYYQRMRDGTYPASFLGSGPIIRDPADNINQVYLQNVLRNPHNWSDPALNKLIAAQDVELDPVKRKAMFVEIVDILQQGEGHAIPIAWRHWGGMLDYRIRNWYAPPTIQLVHKWDHLWFDPDREMPKEPGYQP